MKTLKIFLASSNELQPEREMMASLANSLNTVLEKQGVNVIVVQWENLDASMGVNHKQEDYNEKLRECDMCMVLYWTKFGMYTKIELETAFNELKAGHNPKKVYVYFKEDESTVAEELKEFRDSFPTRYGHFYTPFSNFDTLKAHFLLQFMEYQSQVLPEGRGVEVRNGKVTIDGTDYVDLKNVPFAGNNEEYQLLQKNIKKTQKLLAITETDDPDYSEYAKDLNEMKEKLAKMESSLWDTALMITRLSTTKCSERLERAMQLFNKGDNKGAQAVLNEEDIDKDIEHSLNLIQLGEVGRTGLETAINALELKVKTFENLMSDGWIEHIYLLRTRISELCKTLYGCSSKEYINALLAEAEKYGDGGQFQKSLEINLHAYTIAKESDASNHDLILRILKNLASASCNCSYPKRALEYAELTEIEIKSAERNSPLYASVCDKLAFTYRYCSDFPKALSFAEEALNTTIQLFGENNVEVAKSYIQVSEIYGEMSLFTEELHAALKGEALLEDLLGGMHTQVAGALVTLGRAYRELGRYQDALSCFEKALTIRQKAFGEINILTSVCYGDIAITYGIFGDFEKELNYHIKSYEINKTIYGENHREIAVNYNNIASAYADLLDYNKAIEYTTKAVELSRAIFGRDEDNVLTYICNLSVYYCEIDKLDKALDACQKAYEISITLHGMNHDTTANILNSQAIIYGKMNDFEKELELLIASKDIRIKVYGEKHPLVAESLLNISCTYTESGKYDLALEYAILSHQIYENIDTVPHELANSYVELGCCLGDNGRIAEAIESILKGISIFEETLLECNKSPLINSYSALSSFYEKDGNFEKAILYQHKCVNLSRSFYGEFSKEVDQALDSLAGIYYRDNKIQASIDCLNNMLFVEDSLFGKNSKEYIGTVRQICADYYEMREYEKAAQEGSGFISELPPETEICCDEGALLYINTGTYYRILQQFDKAEKYILNGISMTDRLEIPVLKAAALNRLARVYRDAGRVEMAKEVYLESASLAHELGKDQIEKESLEELNNL